MQYTTTAFRAVLSLMFSSFCALCVPWSPAQAATIGEQKTIVILVNFQDDTSQPISAAGAHALVFDSVSDFYWEASYQKTFLSGDTFGWFTIPVSKTVCNTGLIAQEADKAATAAGANLAVYDRRIYLAPDNACTAAGYNSGTALPSRTWLVSNNMNSAVIAHELGHNFGLLHSQSKDCGPTVLADNCTVNSFGDPADTMGNGNTPHFNAFQKELLGWLNASGQPPITKVTTSGSYRIDRFETVGTAAKALKIPVGLDPVTGQMTYYYVEYRQAVGFDTVLGNVGNLAAGLLVRTAVEGDGFSSYFLDMTPDSTSYSYMDLDDGALTVGRSYTDSVAGVTIKLAAADASGATVEVTVAGSTPAPACTRAAPTVSLGGPTGTVAAGTTLIYTVGISNKDSSACTAATFNLAKSLPSGWSGTLAVGSLSLSPGATGSTTLSVTSPTTASAGNYGIGVGTSSSAGSAHTASASTTYAVAAAASGTLSETLGTDKTSYLRGETVRMSALVKDNGVAVHGASVRFTVTLPGGGSTVLTATSGSDGYARATYKVGKGKAAIGTYALRADASSGSRTATASTGFSVR